MTKFLIQTPTYLHEGHSGSPEPIVTNCGIVISPDTIGKGTHVHEVHEQVWIADIACCYFSEKIPQCPNCFGRPQFPETVTEPSIVLNDSEY